VRSDLELEAEIFALRQRLTALASGVGLAPLLPFFVK
jgi:hypothetical protein